MKSQNYLRSLLTRHTGNPDAEAVRTYFNLLRWSGDRISVADVSPALDFLKTL